MKPLEKWHCDLLRGHILKINEAQTDLLKTIAERPRSWLFRVWVDWLLPAIGVSAGFWVIFTLILCSLIAPGWVADYMAKRKLDKLSSGIDLGGSGADRTITIHPFANLTNHLLTNGIIFEFNVPMPKPQDSKPKASDHSI